MIISVIGGSSPTNPEHVQLAEEVGRELANRGVSLVCGGLSGIMEAACKGAKSAFAPFYQGLQILHLGNNWLYMTINPQCYPSTKGARNSC